VTQWYTSSDNGTTAFFLFFLFSMYVNKINNRQYWPCMPYWDKINEYPQRTFLGIANKQIKFWSRVRTLFKVLKTQRKKKEETLEAIKLTGSVWVIWSWSILEDWIIFCRIVPLNMSNSEEKLYWVHSWRTMTFLREPFFFF